MACPNGEYKSGDTGFNVQDELSPKRLQEYLELSRRLNERLDLEFASKENKKSTRMLIFIKGIHDDCKLFRIYKSFTNSLQTSSYLFETNGQQLLGQRNSYESIEVIKMCTKLIEANIELIRLLVDLTSPLELLKINRTSIYPILKNIEVFVTHVPSPQKKD